MHKTSGSLASPDLNKLLDVEDPSGRTLLLGRCSPYTIREMGWLNLAVRKGFDHLVIPLMDQITDDSEKYKVVSESVEYGRVPILEAAIKRDWVKEQGSAVHDLGDRMATLLAKCGGINGNTRLAFEQSDRQDHLSAWEHDLATCRTMLSAVCPVIPDVYRMGLCHHYSGDPDTGSTQRWDQGAIALTHAAVVLTNPQIIGNHSRDLLPVYDDRSWVDRLPGGKTQALRLMRRVWDDSYRPYGFASHHHDRVMTAAEYLADLLPVVESEAACRTFLTDELPRMLPYEPTRTFALLARLA